VKDLMTNAQLKKESEDAEIVVQRLKKLKVMVTDRLELMANYQAELADDIPLLQDYMYDVINNPFGHTTDTDKICLKHAKDARDHKVKAQAELEAKRESLYFYVGPGKWRTPEKGPAIPVLLPQEELPPLPDSYVGIQENSPDSACSSRRMDEILDSHISKKASN
jgi:hypothetical protein